MKADEKAHIKAVGEDKFNQAIGLAMVSIRQDARLVPEQSRAATNSSRSRQQERKMTDVTTDRLSGKTCTTQHQNEIVWNGHLCEGANLASIRNDNFCLWTRCGSADVPAGKGREGDIREVNCPACLKLWNDEHGQFGVGA